MGGITLLKVHWKSNGWHKMILTFGGGSHLRQWQFINKFVHQYVPFDYKEFSIVDILYPHDIL